MRKTIAIYALLAALTLPVGASADLAQSTTVGAPTSPAAGVNPAPLVPTVPSRPAAVGSQGSSGSTGSSSRALTPGTGKFEAPNNAPCIGSTGFGSSSSQPGHRC